MYLLLYNVDFMIYTTLMVYFSYFSDVELVDFLAFDFVETYVVQ